eukprot:15100436-Alexandrium_andersonii.AAC.1
MCIRDSISFRTTTQERGQYIFSFREADAIQGGCITIIDRATGIPHAAALEGSHSHLVHSRDVSESKA